MLFFVFIFFATVMGFLALYFFKRIQISHTNLIQSLSDRVATLELEKKNLLDEGIALKTKNVEIETRLEQERTHFEEKIALVLQAKQDLENSFKALSAEALKSNNQSFLEIAKSVLEKFQESAKIDLESRQKSIVETVTPVQESLKGVNEALKDLENKRIEAYAGIRHQISDLLLSQKELKYETGQLAQALRAPSVRGRWGEIQLKRVVEIAGMLPHCDFMEQATQGTGQNTRLRPDMIVHLPGNKNLVVDAKAPLQAYLEALEERTPEGRLQKLKLHAKQVRAHILSLATKNYWTTLKESPEFVVLFLPGEIFFSAALEQDPTLIEVGAEQKVILATPTTLIALLRTASYGWTQEAINRNAEKIKTLGLEIHNRLADLNSHFLKLGKNLSGAVDAYNQSVGSFERRVLSSARKFKELGISSPKTLSEEPNLIAQEPRTPEKTS